MYNASMKKMLRVFWLLMGMALPPLAYTGLVYASVIDTYQFSTVEQEQQYRELTAQLRCPKCQNNNIADSNAIIAEDMRQKVYELMQQGYNKQQVVDYMVTRYGNFVTYDPPLTASTLILWLGPLLVLLGGAFIIFRQTEKRRTDKALVTSAAVVSEEQQQRLQRLLEENGKSAPNSHNEKNNNGEQP